MKHAYLKIGVLFCALLMGMIFASPPSAHATEKVMIYNSAPAPVIFPLYARPGTVLHVRDEDSKINNLDMLEACSRPDMQCTDLETGDTPTATFECNNNGEWQVTETGGTCFFVIFSCCYGQYGGGQLLNYTGPNGHLACQLVRPIQTHNIKLTYKSSQLANLNCQGTENMSTPLEKNYCLFNYDSNAGITGDTGDDMFQVENNAGAFFVYKNDPSYDADTAKGGAYFISRSGGRSSQKLMMPSGPGGTFSDFTRFVNNPPSFMNVEKACPPVEIRICGSMSEVMPPPPAIDAVCGEGDGQSYPSYGDIPSNDLCTFGDAYQVADSDPTIIRWECSPPEMLAGGATAECSAARPMCLGEFVSDPNAPCEKAFQGAIRVKHGDSFRATVNYATGSAQVTQIVGGGGPFTQNITPLDYDKICEDPSGIEIQYLGATLWGADPTSRAHVIQHPSCANGLVGKYRVTDNETGYAPNISLGYIYKYKIIEK
jgi:hypothetical protein